MTDEKECICKPFIPRLGLKLYVAGCAFHEGAVAYPICDRGSESSHTNYVVEKNDEQADR